MKENYRQQIAKYNIRSLMAPLLVVSFLTGIRAKNKHFDKENL
jgi:hypothetical protein